MTKTQLKEYVMRNSNVDFNFNNKRYGIERMRDDDGIYQIYFWEWNNEETLDNHYSSYEEFEEKAKIEDLLVVEILKDIDDADIF